MLLGDEVSGSDETHGNAGKFQFHSAADTFCQRGELQFLTLINLQNLTEAPVRRLIAFFCVCLRLVRLNANYLLQTQVLIKKGYD